MNYLNDFKYEDISYEQLFKEVRNDVLEKKRREYMQKYIEDAKILMGRMPNPKNTVSEILMNNNPETGDTEDDL